MGTFLPKCGADTPFAFAPGRLCPPPLNLIARRINAYWDQNISKSKIKVKILIKIKSEINIKANQNNINRNSSGQECPTHT